MLKASELLDVYFADELLSRKNKSAPIWNAKDVLKEFRKYSQIELDGKQFDIDVPIIDLYGERHIVRNIDNDDSYFDIIEDTIKTYGKRNVFNQPEKSKNLLNLFKMFPKNLFLCGGFVSGVLRKNTLKDFDIFFCADSVEEANDVLYKCLEYMDIPLNSIQVNNTLEIYMNKHVITIKNWPNIRNDIQFIRRVYKSPDQILLGFDIWASRHGWNAEMGYFTIASGAISLIHGMFPIDVTQRSYTYAIRLEKYIREKGYKVWIPGVDRNYSDDIKTPDGFLKIKCAKGLYHYENECLTEFIEYEKEHYRNKYGNIAQYNRCCKCQQRYGYSTIHKDPTKCKLNCSSTIYRFLQYNPGMYQFATYSAPMHYNKDNMLIKNYDGITIRVFSIDTIFNPINSVINGNSLIEAELLNDDEFMFHVKNFSDPYYTWKYHDPGSQNFGRFNPIDKSSSDWYGFERNYFVGILDDQYIALRILFKTYNVPKDVQRIIIAKILRV